MSLDLYLAQMMMEDRVKEALRKAEQTQMVKSAQNSKGTWPLLLSAMRFLRAWWDGGNGRNQPTLGDKMRRKEGHGKLAG